MSKPKTEEGILEFEKILGDRSWKHCRDLAGKGLVSFEKCVYGGCQFRDEL